MNDLDKIGQTQQGIIDYVRQRERGVPAPRKQGTVQKDYLGQSPSTTSRSEDLELKRPSRRETTMAPLGHWTSRIQKHFESVPEATQKAWLDSFKIIEKGFVKQINALKADIEASAEILSTVEPYYEDIIKIGMSPQEYVGHLIDFDFQMGQDPAYQISKLILKHNIRYEDIFPNLVHAEKEMEAESSVSKVVAPLQQELRELKKKVAGVDGLSQREVEEEAKIRYEQIKNFYNQRDDQGNLLYPNAFDRIDDIMELVQVGENLEDAYDLVMTGSRISDDIEYEENENENYSQERNYRRDPREEEKDFLKGVARSIGVGE